VTGERLARAWAAETPVLAPPSGPPIFVVGCPRSGTTLLRMMLDAHPDVAVPPESHFIPQVWRARRRYQRGGIVNVERLMNDIRSTARVRAWSVPDERVRARIDGLDRPTISEVVTAVYMAYADQEGKTRWGDKTPGYSLDIPLLARLFPEARFVHLVRDGRDVAMSFIEVIGPKNFIEAAEVWTHRVRIARRDGSRLGPRRFIEVRYEDLIAEPDATLGQLCSLAGVEFSPEMLRYSERVDGSVPEGERRIHRHLSKPVTKGLRDWRRDMPADDVEAFEAVARGELLHYGYDLRSPKTRPAMRANVTIQRLANRAARTRWQVRRGLATVRHRDALPPPRRW